MYLIVAPAGACLLERRPAGGLWGGLWSPPQRGADCTADEICREFGIDSQSVRRSGTGRVFRHVFSHFRLDIEPVYLMLDEAPLQAADGNRARWYQPDAAGAVGLPAPAVKLLAGIADVTRDWNLT